MIVNILTLFIFVALSDCTVDNQGILLEISSGDNVCNSDKLFKNYQFSETPEFSAMCNIPVPNESQVKFLIENNVIPILCMGIYDVSLRLCNEAVNHSYYFKEVFPPSPMKFNDIFNRLKQSEEYSDLNKFCSETVTKYNTIESVSHNTKFWWNEFNNKLSTDESCKSICRTNDFNSVHPLCSYIAWTNDLIHNREHSLEESEIAIESKDTNLVQPALTKKVVETSAAETPDGDDKKSVPIDLKTINPVSEANIIDQPVKKLISVGSDQQNVPNIVNGVKEITAPTMIESAKSTVNSSSDTSNNEMSKPSDKSENNLTKKIEEKQHEKDLSNVLKEGASAGTHIDSTGSNLTTKIEEKQHEKDLSNVLKEGASTRTHIDSTGSNLTTKIEEKQPEEVLSIVPKDEVIEGGAAPVDVKTDIKNKDQSKPEIPEETDQNDFIGEINLDNGPSDPTIGIDPDIQQQFEEGQEEDDEDEAIVGDNPEKAETPMNQENFNKLHNDQGKPDEVYSEVDRTVLIEDPFIETEDTHFFSYFMSMSLLTMVAYLAFHNKNKLLALAVEGRRSKNSRRRPNSSNYSKLDCNLEEAMVSNTTASVTHVLY